MPRVMGIDFGEARIGLALSDPMGIIAAPLEVLHEKDKGQQIKRVVALAIEHEVAAFVVGIPYKLDGSVGEMAEMAEKYAAKLEQVSAKPVQRWDERMSSMAAERALTGRDQRGGSRRKRKGKPLKGQVDKVAAALILKGWLDAGGMNRL